MDKKDKYGFQTTSLTMVEKLARGEDWQRFCERYAEPIKNKFKAINWKSGNPLIDAVDEDDAIVAIFEKLKKDLKRYDHAKGRLRVWLSTVIRNAIYDYSQERKKNQKDLLLTSDTQNGVNGDAADPKTVIESYADVDRQQEADKEWVEFLQISAIKFAEICRPWSTRDKDIIKVIKDELSKDKTIRRPSCEIADQFKITEENYRQICHRFVEEVRRQYGKFRNDDPAFFHAIETSSITFEELLDEYLKMDGGDEDEKAERRKNFKDRHLL